MSQQSGGPTVVFRCGQTQPMFTIRIHLQQYPELSDEDFDTIMPTAPSSSSESQSSLTYHKCTCKLSKSADISLDLILIN